MLGAVELPWGPDARLSPDRDELPWEWAGAERRRRRRSHIWAPPLSPAQPHLQGLPRRRRRRSRRPAPLVALVACATGERLLRGGAMCM